MIKLDGALKLAEVVSRIIGVASYDLQLTSDQHKHLRDALSNGQLMSKLKVVEMLYLYKMNRVSFIGHWHGGLPRLLKNWGIIKEAIGIELDPFWNDFSKRVNWDWNFVAIIGDACSENTWYTNETELVVNTSCEHMNWKWLEKIPDNVGVFVQATDMESPDHINKIMSLENLEKIMIESGRNIVSSNALELHNGYSRWSVLAR